MRVMFFLLSCIHRHNESLGLCRKQEWEPKSKKS